MCGDMRTTTMMMRSNKSTMSMVVTLLLSLLTVVCVPTTMTAAAASIGVPWNGVLSLSSKSCSVQSPRLIRFLHKPSSDPSISSSLPYLSISSATRDDTNIHTRYNVSSSILPGFACTCSLQPSCCKKVDMCAIAETYMIAMNSGSTLIQDPFETYSVLLVINGTFQSMTPVPAYQSIMRITFLSSDEYIPEGCNSYNTLFRDEVPIMNGYNNFRVRIDPLMRAYLRICIRPSNTSIRDVFLNDAEITLYFLYH